jgi:transcriptional regulator with XRE-family HTH domain
MSKLSTFLLRERETRDWSRQDLADKSGIPYPTIARWENPRSRVVPDHEGIRALARAFEMPASRVLAFIGYPVRESLSNGERDKRWEEIRHKIEADPRAERVFELWDGAEEENKDTALTILEAHLASRRRRRR